MPRYMTLEEASRELPDVERIIRRLRRIREVPVPPDDLEERQREVTALVKELEDRGAALRDLDMGLVDFPSLAGAAQIYLCWKIGEESIGFWHGLSEGYASRKPLSVLPKIGHH